MSIGPLAQGALLSLARSAITSPLEAAPASLLPALDERPRAEVEQKRGCFVTLHAGDELRGCVGTFREDLPLWRNVREMARAAAFHDTRFPPVRAEEMAALRIDISVLSPRRDIADPSEIELGRHGLWVEQRKARGVLLPQVAVEHGFDVPEFLDATCRKAGLPSLAWQDPSSRVSVFEAQVFGERHFQTPTHGA